MKIAYDSQIFENQSYGGISRYFYELANRLDTNNAKEINPCIVSPLFVNEYLANRISKLMIIGQKLPNIKGRNRIARYMNRHISPLILKRLKPDILHETYYSYSSVAPKNSRIVVTVYDMIHEKYPQYFSNHDTTTERKKRAVQRADHVVCISENTRSDLIDFFNVSRDKTSVVYLGFSLQQSVSQNLQKQRRPYFLYVGNRGGYKNFKRLLEAYSSKSVLHNNFDLVCFGGGSFTNNEVLLLESLSLDSKKVRQIAGDDSILNALYKQAYMFIYPSLYEGFGIPPLEAMSFGCPVACSNTSSIPEVVGDAGILFDPYDIDAITDSMVKIVEDADCKSNLVQLGYERIKNFSWDKCASETMSVYMNLLS